MLPEMSLQRMPIFIITFLQLGDSDPFWQILTLKQETEDVQQKQYAHAIQVGEEAFVVVQGQVVGDDVADDVSNAYHY